MSLIDTILSQPVANCMTDWFVTLHHAESLELAARTLRDRDIGLLLVTDGDELVGVISERDIVTAVADDDRLPSTVLADRARADVLTIPSTHSLQTGIRMMVEGGTRHLVVTDDEGKPVGVLSARDVLSELSTA
jgi:CBS domain-containing protein